MNYILTLLLAILCCINYYANKRNILAPSVIASAVFLLSSFALACNTTRWAYEVDGRTIIIIMVCLILFSLSANSRFSFTLFNHRNKNNIQESVSFPSFSIARGTLLLLSIFSVIISLAYFAFQYLTARSIGNTEGVDGMLHTLRDSTEESGISTLLKLALAYVHALGYLCCYLQIENIVCKRRRYMELIPIVSMIASMILSTGRGGLITVVCAVVFDLYIIMKRKGKRIKTGKFVRYMILALLLFICVFWLVGIWLRKNEVYSLFDTLSIYFGSSILNFDFLQTLNIKPTNNGASSFVGVYNVLHMFGIAKDVAPVPLPYNRWNGIKYGSNVYSSFAFYYCDFGIEGLLFSMIALGFLMKYTWRKFNTTRNKSLLLFTYGRYWGYAVAMFSIAERVCSQYLAMNVVAELLIECVLIKCFIKSADGNAGIEARL